MTQKLAICMGTIAQLCWAMSSQLRHAGLAIDNRKKLVKQQYLPHMSIQYGELRPLAAEIVSLVWRTPANFNGFRVLAALLRGRPQWASAKLYGVEQRAPPIFDRAAITLGTGPHSSFFNYLFVKIH